MRLGSALERFGGNYGMQMKMEEGVGGCVCVCVCMIGTITVMPGSS